MLADGGIATDKPKDLLLTHAYARRMWGCRQYGAPLRLLCASQWDFALRIFNMITVRSGKAENSPTRVEKKH